MSDNKPRVRPWDISERKTRKWSPLAAAVARDYARQKRALMRETGLPEPSYMPWSSTPTGEYAALQATLRARVGLLPRQLTQHIAALYQLSPEQIAECRFMRIDPLDYYALMHSRSESEDDFFASIFAPGEIDSGRKRWILVNGQRASDVELQEWVIDRFGGGVF